MKSVPNYRPLLVFPLLIGLLTTLQSITPGLLSVKTTFDLSFSLILFLIYLVVSDIFQVINQQTYRKSQKLAQPLYLWKTGFSLIVIWNISSQLTPQYGILLLLYELFQFFIFFNSYHYQQTLLYTCLNAFFKGIIFNIMISTHYPYSFEINEVAHYYFSFLLIFLTTLFHQIWYTFNSKNSGHQIQLFVSVILISYSIYQLAMGQLHWVAGISLAIILLATLFLIKKKPAVKQKELIITLASLLSLISYYLGL